METIAELIAHPEKLNKDTLHGLREFVAKYPYYQAARLLFFSKNFFAAPPPFDKELKKVSFIYPTARCCST